MDIAPRARSNARLILAAIRFVNGAMALLAPHALARRLAVDADRSPALLYFQRMFGIRTILIALDLVTGDDEDRRRALRRGLAIHAADATAAALAGRRGNLARRPTALTIAISLVNLLLTVIARPQPRKGGRFGMRRR